jgi:hypothetical protein
LVACFLLTGVLTVNPVATTSVEAKKLRGAITGIGVSAGRSAVRAATRDTQEEEINLDKPAGGARAYSARPAPIEDEDDVAQPTLAAHTNPGKAVCIAGC